MPQLEVSVLMVVLATVAPAILEFGQQMLVPAPTQIAVVLRAPRVWSRRAKGLSSGRESCKASINSLAKPYPIWPSMASWKVAA